MFYRDWLQTKSRMKCFVFPLLVILVQILHQLAQSEKSNVVHRRQIPDVASEADVTTLAGVSVGQHWLE